MARWCEREKISTTNQPTESDTTNDIASYAAQSKTASGRAFLGRCQAASSLPMASLTRSARRAEGFSPHVNGDAITRPGAVAFPAGRRIKRLSEAADNSFESIKKTRIAVEFITKPLAGATVPNSRSAPVAAKPPHGNMAGHGRQPAAAPNHQEKVVNGIKHEPAIKPEPYSKAGREGGRKLRSQEATRFKSELSAYFPDYDEVIGNDPKEECKL